MKKIGMVAVLCTLAITAGAWGLDRGFVSQPFLSTQGAQHRVDYTSSALYILLRGGKSDFTVCVDDYAFENSFNKANEIDKLGLLRQTLSQWITQTRQQIEEANRSAEFADILKWLPTQLTLTSTSCDKADIRLKTISQRPAGRNVWAYDSSLGTWQILFSYGESAWADAWKETGLFWGLGVLTETFRPQTVAQGRHENTTSEKYSLYSVSKEHPAPGASVMWWKQPAAVSLTCDDVEGFINAVDFVQFMEGETSPRLENGWKSLCGLPYYYLRGRVTTDEEEMDILRQETSQYRQDSKTLNTLQKLLTQWDAYQQTQVIPALSDSRKSLAALARPLDDKGLMLSAQVNHLEQVSDRVFTAIRRIKEYGSHLQLCAGVDCPRLRAELDQLNISTQQNPLQMPELLQAVPLKKDFPTGEMHTCATCGETIEIGKESRDAMYERKKRQTVRYPYFRHATCQPALPEQARTYQDNVTKVQAPTYAQLQARIQQAEELAAHKHTVTQTDEITLPFQDNIPVALQRSIATSMAKTTTSTVPQVTAPVKTVSTVAANTPAKHDSQAIGTVLPGKKEYCSVCGEEIHEGEEYYKRTGSQFIHRHGQCAYSFFTKKHNVDEESLASYARTYSFETPAEVASARADMKALGLSVDSVRQFRTQAEAAAQQEADVRLQEQARQQARKQLNTQCRVYMKVTAQDVEKFKNQYAKQLARIADKEKSHKKLTQRQKMLRKYYEQLLKDEKTTQECLTLERAAAR